MARANSRKRGRVSFQWQSVLEKAAGRDPVSTDAFGNGGMDLALAGLGKGTFFRKGPLPLCFLRLQSLSALECAVTLSVPLRFFKRGAVPVDGGNQIRHELHDFVHIAGAGDLFKAAGRIVQHAQIVGFGQTSDMGGGLADHLRVARLFALDGALQSFIQFRKQGTDGFVRCLALLLSILERPFLSVLCGKGRFLFRCFGNGWNGLLLAQPGRRLLREGREGGCPPGVRGGRYLFRWAGWITGATGTPSSTMSSMASSFVLAVGREPCPQGARQAASSSNERGPGCGLVGHPQTDREWERPSPQAAPGGFADGFGQVDDLRLQLKPKSGQRKFRLIAQRFVQHQNVVGEAAFFVRQRRTEHERFIRLVGLGRQGQRRIVSGSKRQGGSCPAFWGKPFVPVPASTELPREPAAEQTRAVGLMMAVGSPTHSSRLRSGTVFKGVAASERCGAEACSGAGRFSASFSCVGISSGASTCLGQSLIAVLLLGDGHRFPDPFRGICRGA